MLLVRGAIVDYALELASVVFRIPWGAPDSRDAEVAAATLIIVVGAIDLAPSMRATNYDPPAVLFGVP
jgi:hypothetical protein